MKNNLSLVFQIAMVFIGTIVGAGLASGQEITQFFTSWGSISYLSILIPCFIYILVGIPVIKLSIKYNLSSYNDLSTLISPGIFGKITSISTTIFLISSTSIIMAGSGAILHQYFGISKWYGTIFLSIISIITLLRNTKGLIEINSFIVPSLIFVIGSIFALYLGFSNIFEAPLNYKCYYPIKEFWLYSSIIYGAFNILSCCGVIVPISNESKKEKFLILGLIIGAIILTVLSSMINLMLSLNIPHIFKYEIPLLYVAHNFGKIFQVMLLFIIFLEMFSTSVSNIYSISKTLNSSIGLSYKKSIILIILISLPISMAGFGNLISVAYPAFGVLSLVFIFLLLIFYFKDK